MEIHKKCLNCTLSLSQSQSITNLLEENGLQDCKPVFRNLKGTIGYQSTTEAEHISAVEAGKEILWMHQLMESLGMRCLVHHCLEWTISLPLQ